MAVGEAGLERLGIFTPEAAVLREPNLETRALGRRISRRMAQRDNAVERILFLRGTPLASALAGMVYGKDSAPRRPLGEQRALYGAETIRLVLLQPSGEGRVIVENDQIGFSGNAVVQLLGIRVGKIW